VRSRARLARALRSGRLNQPQRFIVEESVASEAGIALAAVRVEDPEGRPAARWTGPVAGDHHLRSLADHVPAEPDPRSAGQLQPDPGRLADGAGEATAAGTAAMRVGRFEHDEADPGPPGQRCQPSEPIRESHLRATTRAARNASRQVDDKEVHRSTGQQRPGDRQALVGIDRRQHDEPLRPDAAGHDLDRVEGGREVQPGDDRAGGLRGGGKPQRERGPAARRVAAQRDAHPPRHAAGTQDGVELGEPGREDSIAIRLRERTLFERDRGERADHVPGEARCGRTPARSKRRQGRAEVRIGCRHRTPSIEQMFE
jgi:hypothetical protein